MHINDTGIRTYDDGKFLVNVQVPSLAAYIPAYKLLTIHNSSLIEIETIQLDSVPRFKELFPLYEREYACLDSLKSPSIWNREILSTANYHDYTAWHLKELVRLRFLKADWPTDLRKFIVGSTGREMLDYLVQNSRGTETETETETETDFNAGDWTGQDLIYDLYRLKSADKLAFPDIGKERLGQYQRFFALVEQATPNTEAAERVEQLRGIGRILDHFMQGAPADHFYINLNSSDSILVAVD